MTLPVIISVIEPEALAQEVKRNYNLSSIVSCQLLRAYVNDVYIVETEEQKYIIKVYRANVPHARTKADIHYEMELLQYLEQQGIGVASAIPRIDGSMLSSVAAPEGERYMALFDYAQGEKPKPPFSEELYYRVGHELARFHNVAAQFSSTHQRFQLNEERMLQQALIDLKPFLKERPDDFQFLSSLVDKTNAYLSTAKNNGLQWSVCHGDATLDNLHVTEDKRIIFYDFDSGGPGWAALDLLGVYQWQKFEPEVAAPLWQAYLGGYTKVRQLHQVELDSLPYFHVMYTIWSMGCDASFWARTSGLWKITEEYLTEEIEGLKQWERAELP